MVTFNASTDEVCVAFEAEMDEKVENSECLSLFLMSFDAVFFLNDTLNLTIIDDSIGENLTCTFTTVVTDLISAS